MIKTNNVPRPVIYGYELTDGERAQFNYIDWEAVKNGEDNAEFFRFRGDLYDLRDCERVTDTMTTLSGWHGFYGQTYFSAVVFKYSDDFDFVTVGYWSE